MAAKRKTAKKSARRSPKSKGARPALDQAEEQPALVTRSGAVYYVDLN